MMNSQQTRRFLSLYAQNISENAAYLTELDAAIGDADHGSNMERGMSAVLCSLPESGTPADLLKSAAMTLISKVGSASGPLYGTALLRAATSTAGREEWSEDDLKAAFEAAYRGLCERGKAEVGDKTMLDVWRAAVDALPDVNAAAKAAQAAAEASRDLLAKKGRASYLGERSVGHLDPGSVSSALLFGALAGALGMDEK